MCGGILWRNFVAQAKEPTVKLAVVLGFLVVTLWVINLVVVYCWPERGTFGDMFGAVNALFTGLAFAAVIYAILIQRHEVGLLKKELSRSKEILEEQQALAGSQIKAQKKQQFEATFFNLFRVFSDLVSNMDLVRSTDHLRTTGRDVFPIFLDRIERSNLNTKSDGFGGNIPLPRDQQPVSEVRYEKFYEKHSSELGHYFRTLFNLFKFVDHSELDEQDKRIYTNLIRAQLSNAEIIVLFLNGLSEKGHGFKPYMEKYTLLKNVDQGHALYLLSRRKGEYAHSAFETIKSPAK
jgi:hypothetical protein